MDERQATPSAVAEAREQRPGQAADDEERGDGAFKAAAQVEDSLEAGGRQEAADDAVIVSCKVDRLAGIYSEVLKVKKERLKLTK